MIADRQQIARAFGQALRAGRLVKGLTQEQLADEAELDRTTPGLYERGLRSPTLFAVIKIAPALGIEPTDLLSATLDRLRANQERR